MSNGKGNTVAVVKTADAWVAFENQFAQRSDNIATMLPSNVDRQKFGNSVLAAVRNAPDLLTCTRQSLFNSIIKSAMDGLVPDGREGVITAYNEKQPGGGYAKIARWNPMTHGMRKRAKELESIIVSTNVVHENDDFIHEEGDEPKLSHRPAPLGTDRGKMIGVYAIFRRGESIIHREVMDATQVAAVRAQSKLPDGLMWTKFPEEAWRKSVLRRGFKSVPCSSALETILRRDDEDYDLSEKEPQAVTRVTVPDRPRARVVQAGKTIAAPPIVGHDAPAVDDNVDAKEQGAAPDVEKAEKWLSQVDDEGSLSTIWESHFAEIASRATADDAMAMEAVYARHLARVRGDLPKE
jgi:recombination protein RecT